MASLIFNLLSVIFKRAPVTRKNVHGLPLPSVCHLKLSSDEIGDRPVFVIGDVHGCLEELTQLMNLVTMATPNVLFVSVGDLVNRGPDSVGVVRKMRSMAADGHAYAVRGNHDESTLREVDRLREDPNYALHEKYTWIRALEEEDVAYLKNLPYTIEIPSLNSLIVHAGVLPGCPLELQHLNTLTNMRNIIDTGDPFEGRGLVATNSHAHGEAWVNLWPGPMHVYFGHDARRKLQLCEFATGLDTGCCHGGELTGVFINTSRRRIPVILTVKSKQPDNY